MGGGAVKRKTKKAIISGIFTALIFAGCGSKLEFGQRNRMRKLSRKSSMSYARWKKHAVAWMLRGRSGQLLTIALGGRYAQLYCTQTVMHW